MLKQILKISLIFVCCLVLLSTAKNGYSDSILGAGVSIKTDGKTGHGVLKINSVTYQAQNLTIQMGNPVKISGDIFNGKEKSRLVLTGINVKDTLYKFSGIIVGKNGIRDVNLDLYIVGANPPPLPPATKKVPQPNHLELIVKSPEIVVVTYNYGFSVKVFDKKINPTGNYDQKTGNIQGVKISVSFKDNNNKIVKTLNGVTDNQGYYADSFRILNYLPSTPYYVTFNATKSGYISDSVIKTVFVHANSR
ncbi:MAG: hypothetical protein KGI28_03230 [Thaumarchaeota archaeon]|nr:hypothetical protein [Nitrososphaerota archaeon]